MIGASFRTGNDECGRRDALVKSFSLSGPGSPHLGASAAAKTWPDSVWLRAAHEVGSQGRFLRQVPEAGFPHLGSSISLPTLSHEAPSKPR